MWQSSRTRSTIKKVEQAIAGLHLNSTNKSNLEVLLQKAEQAAKTVGLHTYKPSSLHLTRMG